MKILAVDYGDSRTGLATCDRTEFLKIGRASCRERVSLCV